MNPQIRHVSLLVTGMFLALLISLTSLQGFARPALWESSSQYGSLTEDSRNARTIYQEYGKARGAIMVNGTAVPPQLNPPTPWATSAFTLTVRYMRQ